MKRILKTSNNRTRLPTRTTILKNFFGEKVKTEQKEQLLNQSFPLGYTKEDYEAFKSKINPILVEKPKILLEEDQADPGALSHKWERGREYLLRRVRSDIDFKFFGKIREMSKNEVLGGSVGYNAAYRNRTLLENFSKRRLFPSVPVFRRRGREFWKNHTDDFRRYLKGYGKNRANGSSVYEKMPQFGHLKPDLLTKNAKFLIKGKSLNSEENESQKRDSEPIRSFDAQEIDLEPLEPKMAPKHFSIRLIEETPIQAPLEQEITLDNNINPIKRLIHPIKPRLGPVVKITSIEQKRGKSSPQKSRRTQKTTLQKKATSKSPKSIAQAKKIHRFLVKSRKAKQAEKDENIPKKGKGRLKRKLKKAKVKDSANPEATEDGYVDYRLKYR